MDKLKQLPDELLERLLDLLEVCVRSLSLPEGAVWWGGWVEWLGLWDDLVGLMVLWRGVGVVRW